MPSVSQNIKSALNKFGKDATVNIFARVTSRNRIRFRYRTQWRYNGPGVPMTPISTQKIPYRAPLENTGRLQDSLDFDVTKDKDGFVLTFYAVDYAFYIERGRKPGKGIPPDILKRWIETKPIRMRNEVGQFVQMNETRKNQLTFLINRKIKTFGIDPVPFIEEGFSESLKSFEKEFTEMGISFVVDELLNAIRPRP